MSIAHLLPEGLAADIEAACGARIAAIRPRGGGGASREGAEIDLVWPDARTASAYMNYDVHKAGAGDDAAFLREAAVLRALSGPLAGAGVRTAPYFASLPQRRALLCGLVSGKDRFAAIADAAQRHALAGDFMAQLAALHRIDVAATPVEGMGAVLPTAALIGERIAALRAANTGRNWDPLIHLSLGWLEANIPAEMPPPVIVHGDAGAGNFLFEGDHVTALLDWELVHYGDPMADLAMLCLRMLFHDTGLTCTGRVKRRSERILLNATFGLRGTAPLLTPADIRETIFRSQTLSGRPSMTPRRDSISRESS